MKQTELNAWTCSGAAVYQTHKSERGAVENKFAILVQPGIGVDQAEAEKLAQHLCEILPVSLEPTHSHIDDFIDYCRDTSPETTYARWFFMLHRFPTSLQQAFAKQLEQYQLYCTYEGETYRVTGASRLGDVWLTRDFSRTSGYDIRVLLTACTEWRPTP